jgi:hypothetical protein
MYKAELEKQLNVGEQYKGIWLESPNEQCICAPINGDAGWLMCLRFEGDEYPKKWTYPLSVLKEALFSFIGNSAMPKQLEWLDDSH